MYCYPSFEPSHRDGSDEGSQNTVLMGINKNNQILPHTIALEQRTSDKITPARAQDKVGFTGKNFFSLYFNKDLFFLFQQRHVVTFQREVLKGGGGGGSQCRFL